MKFLIIILSTILVPKISRCQQMSSIELGKSVMFSSSILHENRELLIYSPKNTGEKKRRFPVIYLFDGESLFFSMVGAVAFLNYGSHLPQIPEAYIVAVVNSDRNRDMPIPQVIEKTSGAENFYKFLSAEIVPFINGNYATNGLNILVGHSQGGLFVTYAGLQEPRLFPFIVALDAPMTVDPSVQQSYLKKIRENCGLTYVSVESKYGWRNEIADTTGCLTFKSILVKDESHETMPYKGIYEGLKYLFSDYIPPAQDLSLQELDDYYNKLNVKHHFRYVLPAPVILESARQNIGAQKKDVAVELINKYNELYGSSPRSEQLLAKAFEIKNGPDERVAYSLHHPPPDKESVKDFFGKWKGVLKVPGGTDMDIVWEIKLIDGVYKMEANVMNQFKDISGFLYVNEKHELVWGRKHDGGGIYLSIGTLSKDGLTIKGSENMTGFSAPPDVPPLQPNTFIFHKIR